jgi:hypothetical protein
MRIFGTALLFATLAAGLHATCHAQSFPGRDGHWEATVKSAGQEPITLEFCLNNDTH